MSEKTIEPIVTIRFNIIYQVWKNKDVNLFSEQIFSVIFANSLYTPDKIFH